MPCFWFTKIPAIFPSRVSLPAGDLVTAWASRWKPVNFFPTRVRSLSNILLAGKNPIVIVRPTAGLAGSAILYSASRLFIKSFRDLRSLTDSFSSREILSAAALKDSQVTSIR